VGGGKRKFKKKTEKEKKNRKKKIVRVLGLECLYRADKNVN